MECRLSRWYTPTFIVKIIDLRFDMLSAGLPELAEVFQIWESGALLGLEELTILALHCL